MKITSSHTLTSIGSIASSILAVAAILTCATQTTAHAQVLANEISNVS